MEDEATEISAEEALVERALAAATDTQFLLMAAGARHETSAVFAAQFGAGPAIIIADDPTRRAAGDDVQASFRRTGAAAEMFVFGPHLYADEACVAELQAVLARTAAIPVAVGSGTINDVTKLAAHRAGRPYLVVATAASMDGYTAYGASITARGSKQTFDCPAPRAIVADLDVIADAPPELNAAGYADLLAKIPAGADWIVADALGIERIQPNIWASVQSHLRAWVAQPEAIARGDAAALRRLMYGLLMTGFAMQAARSSRPASGAEHQFSHLWDMQHHTHAGAAPSHGFKVGIGTLASAALYEQLLASDVSSGHVEAAVERWPAIDEQQRRIADLFGAGELADKALEESAAKYISADALRRQLARLVDSWPKLCERLRKQLLPRETMRQMLAAAGCPSQPEAIGISRARLRASYPQALAIRRRFTVLDLAERTGRLDAALAKLFGPGGPWQVSPASP